MKIGGLQKLSLIDFPGKIAAVVFTQGCDFRCPFCHNPELVLPDKFGDLIDTTQILQFLSTRVGKLNGVVITGGEPTIQPDLSFFLEQIKILGFSVKLDTNGNHPDKLKPLLSKGLIDYIAMDVKAPPEKYPNLTGTNVDMKNIDTSIKMILSSGVSHEFRTTLLKSFLSNDDVRSIRDWVRGAQKYSIKSFSPGKKLIDNNLDPCESYTEDEIVNLKKEFEL